MGSPALGTQQGRPALGRLTGSCIETLVRQLVKKLANHHPAAAFSGADGKGRDVLLDLEVDGLRCLVIRVPPRTRPTRLVLSPREREIARMVAKGYPNKTIAGVLDISMWTVSTYLRRIFAKLSVGSRAAMVARLLADGLLGDHPAHLCAASLDVTFR